MSSLTVFNSDVIPVYTTDTGEKVVVGRELHEKLKIKTEYKDWFPRMCEYGFQLDKDFSEIAEEVAAQNRARTYEQKNHIMSLDMAKHIAMIQRTPEGKAIRDKLITLETDISNLSPELRLLIKLEVSQKQQQKALQETNDRIDRIGDVIALDTRSWRKDAHDLIIRIAQVRGGYDYIRDINTEIFRLVDSRGGVSLKTRLTNKRQRMADEGICKSKRDKLTQVDIIADDKKLIEIYVAIVKEMAVKYGATSKSA